MIRQTDTTLFIERGCREKIKESSYFIKGDRRRLEDDQKQPPEVFCKKKRS